MPSFRVSIEIEDLRPGHHPDEVMDTARAAVASVAHLDTSFLDLADRIPFIAVRFTVPPANDHEEDAAARLVAEHAIWEVARVARLGESRLHRRRAGRWLEVRMEP